MEELLLMLDKLKAIPIIIVEGKKDKAALESLGIGHVRTLDKPLFEVCEEVADASKEAAILTDLDREGKKLYSKVKENLERLGVRVNDEFRNYLFRETDLRQIEGLATYIQNLADDPFSSK